MEATSAQEWAGLAGNSAAACCYCCICCRDFRFVDVVASTVSFRPEDARKRLAFRSERDRLLAQSDGENQSLLWASLFASAAGVCWVVYAMAW